MVAEFSITIKEARKILGKEAKGLSDEAISAEIRAMSAIAGILINELPKTRLYEQLKRKKHV